MALCGKILGIVICDQMFCEREQLEVFLVYSGITKLPKAPSNLLLTINI